MSQVSSKSESNGGGQATPGGLFRTVIAGPGHSLAEAIAHLERTPQVERLLRHPKRDLLGARVNLTPQEGQGYWELTRIRDDLYVIIENFAYKDPRLEFVPGDGLVQFNFKISGDMTIAVTHTEPLRFNRPSLLVWSQPPGMDTSEWTAPRAHERNVAISMRPQFLLDHFLATTIEVPERLLPFVSDQRYKIDHCQMPLSAQMCDSVMRLINNPFTGPRALLYTEALTTELLCSAVEAFCTLSAQPSEEYTDRELRCLHGARDILMRQLSRPPTIRQLARAVGIAETTLIHGFKSAFGETIADFGTRCRMQHALTQLRDRHDSVAKVAEAVGYAHATSFTTAFRRHFNMRPIDVRRTTRR